MRPQLQLLEERALLSNFSVSSTADSGAGSLRAAIVAAAADTSDDTITFSSLFNTAQTITLTSGSLSLMKATGTLTIDGPGANSLSVSGSGASRVFALCSKQGSTAHLPGLTITGGKASDFGGGMIDEGGTVTLTDCTVSGNTATDGGGLAILDKAGGPNNLHIVSTATLINCTGSGNSASYGGADPALTDTPSGTLYDSDTYSVITGVSLSTTTGAAATAGTNAIVATGGTAANFAITEVNGVLTVNQAALTVTAKSSGKIDSQTVTFAGTEFTTSGLDDTDSLTSVTLSSPLVITGHAHFETERFSRRVNLSGKYFELPGRR